MTIKTFDLWQVYGASPVIWGSVQNTATLTFGYKGAPILQSIEPGPSQAFVYDALGRLVLAAFLPQGSTEAITYDAAGNRTSIVVAAGPGGL
jgi:YD repeat-containing protein